MSEGLSSSQLTALCVMFLVFHLLAVPPFVWALRHEQFRGREQAEWSLDDPDTQDIPAAKSTLTPWRVRWMLGVLVTLGALMLFSVVLTLVFAVSAPAHPAVGAAKCPF